LKELNKTCKELGYSNHSVSAIIVIIYGNTLDLGLTRASAVITAVGVYMRSWLMKVSRSNWME
jgi:hypothetical protein